MTFPAGAVDHRARPERYRVGRGEVGVFHVEPYKGKLLPLWTIRTPELVQEAAEAISARFRDYRDAAEHPKRVKATNARRVRRAQASLRARNSASPAATSSRGRLPAIRAASGKVARRS